MLSIRANMDNVGALEVSVPALNESWLIFPPFQIRTASRLCLYLSNIQCIYFVYTFRLINISTNLDKGRKVQNPLQFETKGV